MVHISRSIYWFYFRQTAPVRISGQAQQETEATKGLQQTNTWALLNPLLKGGQEQSSLAFHTCHASWWKYGLTCDALRILESVVCVLYSNNGQSKADSNLVMTCTIWKHVWFYPGAATY